MSDTPPLTKEQKKKLDKIAEGLSGVINNLETAIQGFTENLDTALTEADTDLEKARKEAKEQPNQDIQDIE